MHFRRSFSPPAFGLAAAVVATLLGSGSASAIDWETVVNNSFTIPGTSSRFNSYGQPSISGGCLVVFRGRSSGGSTPARGVYARQMCTTGRPVVEVAGVGDLVPPPNNLNAPFNEFPAFPRIDITTAQIATRGQTRPVWRYLLPDGTETRVGTAGIFTKPSSTLVTGASQLGAVPGFSHFAVPGAPAGTRFDQFPGAPAPLAGRWIAFKGNYTVAGVGKTGVFVRDVLASSGRAPALLIANSDTRIPNQPAGGTTKFGSTAPPSAAGSSVVFVGSDNEDNPSLGGIYRAPLANAPALTTLVGIGSAVPGVSGATFRKFGEALSYDGRYVGFWASWGTATRSITLTCPAEGQPDLVAYCRSLYPNGYTTTVPVDQGIFVYDTASSTPVGSRLRLIARTGWSIRDFLFWTFSGRPPSGEGDDDAEPARWRASAFVAVGRNVDGQVATAYKAVLPLTGTVAINVRPTPTSPTRQAVLSGWWAGRFDPSAPPGSTFVTTMGLERDGFRNCRLTVNLGMFNASTGATWGGVYLNRKLCAP